MFLSLHQCHACIFHSLCSARLLTVPDLLLELFMTRSTRKYDVDIIVLLLSEYVFQLSVNKV